MHILDNFFSRAGYTSGVVVLTLLVNATTVEYLITLLGLTRSSTAEQVIHRWTRASINRLLTGAWASTEEQVIHKSSKTL